MSINPELFRKVLSQFATGVTIVTTRDGEEIHGLTANSFCSVSLAPPLVLVCVDKDAHSHDLIHHSGNFAVNILTAAQESLARRFASNNLSAAERFAGIKHHIENTGAPILKEAHGWLDCKLFAAYAGGDHTIFVGEVMALGEYPGNAPLLFYQSKYGMPASAS
jgi:flavin reductase (DIM6/NTAB) family NADH-FMN oxidoreductase RutF